MFTKTKVGGNCKGHQIIEELEAKNIVEVPHLIAVVRAISQAHNEIDLGIDVEWNTGISETLTKHFDQLADEDWAAGYWTYIASIHYTGQ